MADGTFPTEVELIYELMPCNAMRVAQEPGSSPHPCAYFRDWGTYHSYDYRDDGSPLELGIDDPSVYVGRSYPMPEALSGCRKAPIMSVGINPNLPGWWRSRRNWLNPSFDDYRQYAHYFRSRSVSKVEMPRGDYREYGGGTHDHPLSDEYFELEVPEDDNGDRSIDLKLQPQKMYEGYEDLLHSMADEMGWSGHRLTVGEDLSYANMVACASARWTTRAVSNDPQLPPMTRPQRTGIVNECFRGRQYFLRQLFQSLPKVLLVFSQTTANALIGELADRFSVGDPQRGERLEDLMNREIRLLYGNAGGEDLDARVIFAPHVSGNPDHFNAVRRKVVGQLVEECEAGNLTFNDETGHLRRPSGACVFCPMLEIDDCPYESELVPLSDRPQLTAGSPPADLMAEKRIQRRLLAETMEELSMDDEAWATSEDQPIDDE